MYIFYYTKGGLISEGILTLVSLPIKGAKSLPWAENLNKLFTGMGEKFKFYAQRSDLTPFVGNSTKIIVPSEIKPPLGIYTQTLYLINYKKTQSHLKLSETVLKINHQNN